MTRRHRNPRYAPESLEPRLSPSAVPAPIVAHVNPMTAGKTSPSKPVPVEPKSPAVPKGDGTPPIAGPSVPGGTTEPA